MPAVAPYRAIALDRLWPSGKLAVSSDSDEGATMAAPTPCRARAAISHEPVGATPTRNEAPTKIARPAMKIRRRPIRSPSRAPSSSRPPKTSDVGVLHPGQPGGREPQAGLDRRQAGEHDRVVEQDQEVADQDDGEDRPGVRRSGLGTGGERWGGRGGCGGGHDVQATRPALVVADPVMGGTGRDSQPPRRIPTLDGVSTRDDLRDFLVTRRARLTPEQAGLQVFGGQRRVSGLRREEVAALAGISIEYYTRLERGSIGEVSDSVLDGVVHALQLDEAERDHLYRLVRTKSNRRPVRRSPAKRRVRPTVQRMLDLMPTPAYLRNGRFDILASNELGRALYSPVYEQGATPNTARFVFLDPAAADFFVDFERDPGRRRRLPPRRGRTPPVRQGSAGPGR